MKFAELHQGRRLTLGPLQVSEPEMIDFAQRFDAQWFHVDPVRSKAGAWQDIIASGWHTCAMAMSLVARDVLAGSEAYASPGLNYLKWPDPVRAGDVLVLELVVLESRRSSGKPDLGIVRWQWLMRNQLHATVLDMEVVSMFNLAAQSAV